MLTVLELRDLLVKSVSPCCEVAVGVVKDNGHPSLQTIVETQETYVCTIQKELNLVIVHSSQESDDNELLKRDVYEAIIE